MDKIGNMLSSERKKRVLEIMDAEHATGIRAVYLNALEQGRYDLLPGEVYVKGFLRNYGNFLELDGSQLVQLYTELKTPPTESPAVVPSAPTTEPTVKKVAAVQSITGVKYNWSKILVVVILVISALGLYLWQKSVSPSEGIAPRNGAKQSAATSTATTNPPLGSAPGSTTSPLPSRNRPVVLTARFTDRCWTSVIADGKTLYEGIPANGAMFTWEADRQIVVNFGNAGAVELTFNGQAVGKIGERGDVVVKTFTVAGMVTPPAASNTPVSPSPSTTETSAPEKPAVMPPSTPPTSTPAPTAPSPNPASPNQPGSKH